MPGRTKKSEEENVSTAKTTPVEKRAVKQTRTKAERESTLKTNPVIKDAVESVKSGDESLKVSNSVNNSEPINGENENTKVTKETKPKTRKNRKKLTTEDVLADIMIQYGGKEISALEIVKKVKQDCKDKGYRKQIRKVSIYVKPEDDKVYYALDNNTDNTNLFEDATE